MTCCWANCQTDTDLGRHGARANSLYWQGCKTWFPYYKWLCLQWESVDVSFAFFQDTRVARDLTLNEAHVESLWWQCCKTRFWYYKLFRPQLKCLDISFALSHGKLLSKLSSGWWFGKPWRSCGVTVMTMLQNAFLVLQMICLQLESVDVSFAISQDMPFNKQSSGWGFDTSWRSCGVTVITMLQNAISVSQIISSPIKVFGDFFCSHPWHAVEQIVNRTVISDAMMLVCRHCNDNVAKRDFSNGRLMHRHG